MGRGASCIKVGNGPLTCNCRIKRGSENNSEINKFSQSTILFYYNRLSMHHCKISCPDCRKMRFWETYLLSICLLKGSALLLQSCLREAVSNFRESGDRSKNSTIFLFAPKDPFGESFPKIIFKSSSEFLFWKKLRKFEIGQNVPNLNNFYWAFSAFSQRSHKTAKNYPRFIFS